MAQSRRRSQFFMEPRIEALRAAGDQCSLAVTLTTNAAGYCCANLSPGR
jgi:hypothetical protein